MKPLKTSVRSLALGLLMASLGSGRLPAQVILQQNFSAGGAATNYAATPPGPGQFSSLDMARPLANSFPPIEADERIRVEFDGIAQADIDDGKLRFILRSAYRKFASPRAADIGGFFWDHGPSSGILLRQPLGNPAPKLLYVQFRLHAQLQTRVEPTPDSGEDVGIVSLSAPSGQQLGQIWFSIRPLTGERLEFRSANPWQFFFGEVLVTVILNHTGTNLTYAAPDGSVETIGGANFDYWINHTKVRDEEPSLVSRPLTVFSITAQSGDPPNMAIRPPEGTLPDDPGPATVFTFDDFVIRRDLPSPDTDGDGLSDLVEAYFGTNPNTPTTSPLAVQRSGDRFALAWPEANPAGKSILVQWSPDLVTWLTNGQTLNGIPARAITLTSPAPGRKQAVLDGVGLAKGYLRLNVSTP